MPVSKNHVGGLVTLAVVGVVMLSVALLASPWSSQQSLPQLSSRPRGFMGRLRTEHLARVGMYDQLKRKRLEKSAADHQPTSTDETEAEFKQDDEDGDGFLSLDEFLDEDAADAVSLEDQEMIYTLLNTDTSDGGISLEEMIAGENNPEVQKALAGFIIGDNDMNGDGKLDMQEFSSFMYLSLVEADDDPSLAGMSDEDKQGMAALVAALLVATLDQNMDLTLDVDELAVMFAPEADEQAL